MTRPRCHLESSAPDWLPGCHLPRWKSRVRDDTNEAERRLDRAVPKGTAQATSNLVTYVELGAQEGHGVSAAQRRGWLAYGIEPDRRAYLTALERDPGLLGRMLWGRSIVSLGVHPSADIIVYNDFLERLMDPVEELELAVQALTPDGHLLVIETDLEEAWHLPGETLDRLLSRFGLHRSSDALLYRR